MQTKATDTILLQLQQYRNTKRMLEEYDAYGLRANPGSPRAGEKHTHGDPTGQQAVAHLAPTQAVLHMRKWVWAIEQTWGMLCEHSPLRAELMALLYGLNSQSPLNDVVCRRAEIMDKLHISGATLYRWRQDIVQAVLNGAIEAGLIRPYGHAANEAE